MDDSPKYRVVVAGVVLPERSRDDVIDALAALFHSRAETMQQLLQGRPVALKKLYARAEADKICIAIKNAGADCGIEEVTALSPHDEALHESPSAVQRESKQKSKRKSQSTSTQESNQESKRSTNDAADVDDADTDTDTESETFAKQCDKGRMEKVLEFVDDNRDYYQYQFKKFGGFDNPNFAFTWHWPSFFGFFYVWAMMRKLWAVAFVHLAGSVVMLTWLQPGIVHIVWTLFWPLTANYLYFIHIRRRLFIAPDPALDRRRPWSRGGGRSLFGLLGGLCIFVLVAISMRDVINERMLLSGIDGFVLREDSHNDLILRQRGDGSMIEPQTQLDSRVDGTLSALNALAFNFRRTVADKTGVERERAIATFEHLIDQRFKDAWGNAIQVRADATGQITLISAGPDGAFNNADDVVLSLNARLGAQ